MGCRGTYDQPSPPPKDQMSAPARKGATVYWPKPENLLIDRFLRWDGGVTWGGASGAPPPFPSGGS